MTNGNRIFAAVAALAMSASLTACGGSQPANGQNDATKVPAGEQVAAAHKKLMEAKSMEVSVNSDIGVKLAIQGEEQTIAHRTEIDMDLFNDPMKAKGQITMGAGEELDDDQSVELYLQQADDKILVYLGSDGDWTKQELDVSMAGTYDPTAALDLYLSNAESFTEAGTEKVDDEDATKFTGVIPMDKINDVLDQSGIMGTLEQFGAAAVSEEDINSMMSEIGDLRIAVWINAEGYPVQYEMNMDDMVDQILSKALDVTDADAQGLTIDVTRAKLSMHYTDFDKVEDFEIPEEARNA